MEKPVDHQKEWVEIPVDDQNERVIKVNEKLKCVLDKPAEIEIEQWQKRSIYKVPTHVADLNKKAYMPQTVSFGPYHHHEPHLKHMEEHKHRALRHFLKRSDKPHESYVSSLDKVVQKLKDSYDCLDKVWQENSSEFLHLMVLDGCFMLEILRTGTSGTATGGTAIIDYMKDYPHNDPIFSKHGKLYFMPYIRRDMFILENQLPMLVLETLVAVQNLKDEQGEDFVNELIVKFCSLKVGTINKMGKCPHVLDVYRKSLLGEKKPEQNDQTRLGEKTPKQNDQTTQGMKKCVCRKILPWGESDDDIIRSAAELHEAGVRFQKSKTTSLKDISFRGGVLKLPHIVVDDVTEPLFLNLIAYERFHVGVGNEVTSYIVFMDHLIDNGKEISLLNSRDTIIQNAFGSDKAVANLFNSLSKDVTSDPDSRLYEVHEEVTKYCSKPWNTWRANLNHTYFRNPWAFLSVIAAIFLFALTIAQTVYSILDYYKP